MDFHGFPRGKYSACDFSSWWYEACRDSVLLCGPLMLLDKNVKCAPLCSVRPKLYRKILVVGKINPGDISAKDMGDKWLSAITYHGKYQTSTQWVVTLGQTSEASYQHSPIVSHWTFKPWAFFAGLLYEPAPTVIMKYYWLEAYRAEIYFSQFWRLKAQYPDAKTGVS